MSGSTDRSSAGERRRRDAAIWELVRRQHGTVARRQLLEAGLGARHIERRIADGRLHPVWCGVYAVGRPELGPRRAAGLPEPRTKVWVNSFEVDFHWPELGIVVEADGLRYHRTASQQARALLRDQTHLAAGLLPLRFSHAQIRYERDHVRETLRRTAALARARSDG